MRALLLRLAVVVLVGAAFASVGALLALERRTLPGVLEQAFAPPGQPAPALSQPDDPRELTHLDPDFGDFPETTWTLIAGFQLAFLLNVPLAAVGLALRRLTRRRRWHWSGEARGWFFLLLGLQAACAAVCALIGLAGILAVADEVVRTRSTDLGTLIIVGIVVTPLLLNATLGAVAAAAWRTLSDDTGASSVAVS